MSLTVSFLAFDLSIPILIHGLFTFIFLRRLIFDIFGKLVAPLPYSNPYVRFDEYSWKERKRFQRNLNQRDRIMGSRCPRLYKTQTFEDNESEVDSRKRRTQRKNSMDSASVQAKMSLDLIVEQLKRELSLKDIEGKEQSVLTNLTTEETEPRDFFEIASEESNLKIINHEERSVTTEYVEETTNPTDVNVISMNLEEELEREERETTNRQGVETISPREPVVKSYEREEENLYGLIRSMIAAEVKRYEERERELLRKVHSDTTDVGGRWTMNKRAFFLLNSENAWQDTKRENVEEDTRKRLDVEEDKNRLERDNDNVDFASMFVIECKKSSDRPEDRKINEGGNTSPKENVQEDPKEGGSTDRETQTERVHTIRAAKSCPLRKRRIYRVFVGESHNKDKLLFGLIHRKASDNLIYEKGKASGSPSYVPLTERFRWRYVGARKAR